MVIILMGVSGSGKTTLGRLLAAELGWRFLDGDDFHPASNIEKMRSGVPLTDSDRLPWLELLHRLLRIEVSEGRSAVVACSALKKAHRQVLADGLPDVRFVYLRGERPLIAGRMAGRVHPFMPDQLLDSQLTALEEPVDAVVVDVAPPPERLVQEIRNRLGV